MDVVSGVRRLFPDVTAAVEQYRQAKPDREARNLARRLANEEVLYDQFIRKLALLQSAVSTKGEDGILRGIESRFGPEIAVELTGDLRQMEEFLRGLKADLANTSRGTVSSGIQSRYALSNRYILGSACEIQADDACFSRGPPENHLTETFRWSFKDEQTPDSLPVPWSNTLSP